MKLTENVLDISHIETWEDIKNTFRGQVEEYPGVNVGPKSGAMGKVWKIKGKDLVLKITTEPAEMKLSHLLAGKENSGFVNIFKITELPSHRYNGRKVPRLMLKIQETCYPIPDLVKKKYSPILHKFIQIIPEHLDYFKQRELKSPEDFKEFYSRLKDTYQDDPDPTLKTILNSEKVQQEYFPILIKLIDLLTRASEDLKNREVEIDFHDGNIMQTRQGVWKLVDF
jgi:hypothetical protein